MALHWAWDFSTRATAQQYADSGWGLPSIASMASTAAPFPRNPSGGLGGMAVGMVCGFAQDIATCAWPAGSLSDGIIQFHAYFASTSTNHRIRIQSTVGQNLLELRPAASTNPFYFALYSGEGDAAQVLRGTSTTPLSLNTWYTISIRFKIGAAGYIEFAVDGVTESIVSAGTTGVTSEWARLDFYTWGTAYVTGITVWDDPSVDTALTVTRWMASTAPRSDDLVVGWTNTGGGTDYADVATVPFSTAEYSYIAVGGTIRFGVDTTADIGAAWAPDAIDGVVVIAGAQGESGLDSGTVEIDDGVDNDTGTSQFLDGEMAQISDAFALQADGATPWDLAAINAHSYGLTVA